MIVTLNINAEVEANLLAQAQAAELPLDQFLSKQLEALTNAASVVPKRSRAPEAPDQWEKEFNEWLDSFPRQPILPDEALRRENWYPDRW